MCVTTLNSEFGRFISYAVTNSSIITPTRVCLNLNNSQSIRFSHSFNQLFNIRSVFNRCAFGISKAATNSTMSESSRGSSKQVFVRCTFLGCPDVPVIVTDDLLREALQQLVQVCLNRNSELQCLLEMVDHVH
jgi:hypothetical protein